MRRALLIVERPASPLENGQTSPAESCWPDHTHLARLQSLRQTLNEREVAATLPLPATPASVAAWAAPESAEECHLTLGVALGHLVRSPLGIYLGDGAQLPLDELFRALTSSGVTSLAVVELLAPDAPAESVQTELLRCAAAHGVCLLAQVRPTARAEQWSLTRAFEELLNEHTLRETVTPTGATMTLSDIIVALRSGQAPGESQELCSSCSSPDVVVLPAMRGIFESETLIDEPADNPSFSSTLASQVRTPRATSGPLWMQPVSSTPETPDATEQSHSDVSPSSPKAIQPADPAPETLHSLVPPGPPTSSRPPPKPRSVHGGNTSSQSELLREAVRASVAGDGEAAVAACLRCVRDYPNADSTYPDVINVLAHFQRWRELLDVYEELAKRQTNRHGSAALFVACAGVAGTHLGDQPLAAAYMSRASNARPGVVDLQKAAARLHEATGNRRASEDHRRRALNLAPLAAESYRELAQLLAETASEDEALQYACALVVLNEGTAEQQALAQERAQMGLPKPNRSLTNEDLQITLAVPSPDKEVDRILFLLADVAIDQWRLKPKEQAKLLVHYQHEDTTTSTATLARALTWSSRFLGLPSPELFLAAEGRTLAPLPLDRDAWVASRPLGRGPNINELVFIWTRALVRSIPPYRVLLPRPTELELVQLALSAHATLLEGGPVNGATADPLAFKAQSLRGEQLDELKSLLSGVEGSELGLRVQAWHARATHFANRCALLACGTTQAASSALSLLSPDDLEQQLGQLLAFSVDRLYLGLRGELGIAKSDAPESEDVVLTHL